MLGVSPGVVVTCELQDHDCEQPKKLRLLTQVAAFDFVHAAPNTVHFTGAQRVIETLRHHGTRGAHLLGARFAVVAFVLGLDADRRKESLGECAFASCLTLPSKTGTPLFFFAAKRHCPPQNP